MSAGPDAAHGGPVSNTGLKTTKLTPAAVTTSVAMAGVVPHLPAPVPLLSVPTHSNGPTITSTQQQAASGSGDPNNLQFKIPPLMGIRTDTLPPPPPVQLPSAVSTHTTSGGATGGVPKVGNPPRLQSKTQELDHDEDSDGDDGKGGESGAQDVVYVNQCACVCHILLVCIFIIPFLMWHFFSR